MAQILGINYNQWNKKEYASFTSPRWSNPQAVGISFVNGDFIKRCRIRYSGLLQILMAKASNHLKQLDRLTYENLILVSVLPSDFDLLFNFHCSGYSEISFFHPAAKDQ